MGMGVIANTTSAEVIARSREEEQGVNNPAMTLGVNVSAEVGFAVGGAVVARFADDLTGGNFAGLTDSAGGAWPSWRRWRRGGCGEGRPFRHCHQGRYRPLTRPSIRTARATSRSGPSV